MSLSLSLSTSQISKLQDSLKTKDESIASAEIMAKQNTESLASEYSKTQTLREENKSLGDDKRRFSDKINQLKAKQSSDEKVIQQLTTDHETSKAEANRLALELEEALKPHTAAGKKELDTQLSGVKTHLEEVTKMLETVKKV